MSAPSVPIEGVAGYIVLTETYGEWKDDWDGEVHAKLRDGYEALAEARAASCRAILVQCVRCPEPNDGQIRRAKAHDRDVARDPYLRRDVAALGGDPSL